MKSNIIAISIGIIIIGSAYLAVDRNSSSTDTSLTTQPPKTETTESVNNVSIVNGKQIIEIKARGGYQPRRSIAKAGIPTILRFNTSGTFDCSSSVRIPSMNISKILPQTGTTDIEIRNQAVTILKGSCGMGMYPFEIEFQN